MQPGAGKALGRNHHSGVDSHPINLYIYEKNNCHMDKNLIRSHLGIILAAGSVWGLTEFAFGLGLQKCGVLFSGAILTGIAFFWVSFAYSLTRSIIPVLLVLSIAVLFKLLDALLLPVSWNHGSILNPVFAFVTLAAGFLMLTALFGNRFFTRPGNRIAVGAGAALVAVSLFPLAGFVTGSKACVVAATNIPQSIYTAPVAIVIAMCTVPLGYYAAMRYAESISAGNLGTRAPVLARLWAPAVVVCCLLIVTIARLI